MNSVCSTVVGTYLIYNYDNMIKDVHYNVDYIIPNQTTYTHVNVHVHVHVHYSMYGVCVQ